jgi:hypothetical protein
VLRWTVRSHRYPDPCCTSRLLPACANSLPRSTPSTLRRVPRLEDNQLVARKIRPHNGLFRVSAPPRPGGRAPSPGSERAEQCPSPCRVDGDLPSPGLVPGRPLDLGSEHDQLTAVRGEEHQPGRGEFAVRSQCRMAPSTNMLPLADAVSTVKSLSGFGGLIVATSLPLEVARTLTWRPRRAGRWGGGDVPPVRHVTLHISETPGHAQGCLPGPPGPFPRWGQFLGAAARNMQDVGHELWPWRGDRPS